MKNNLSRMSDEQKSRLGDKYIKAGTGITNNELGKKYKISQIKEGGVLLEEKVGFASEAQKPIEVPFDEFLDKYDSKEISVDGYTHEVPDQIILHQVINDIIYSANIGQLNETLGELETEEVEFKSGGVIGTIKLAKNGYIKDIKNQFGKRILEVQAGDMIYKWSPVDKTYKSTTTASRLNNANLGVIKVLKHGGIANQYEGMTPEQVWIEWTPEQREQFITDHADNIKDWAKTHYEALDALFKYIPIEFKALPESIRFNIGYHVAQGQYKRAGKVLDKKQQLEESAERIIKNEIYANQNSLVEKLLKDEIIFVDDIQNYFSPAEEGEDEGAPQEVLEWWLISDWLKEKLLEQGEPIIDNEYGTWWGRTTSGQMIIADGIIQKILKKIGNYKRAGKIDKSKATGDEKGYQGWKNYETWNVKLWLDNDAGSQSYWDERATEIAKNSKKSEYLTKKEEARRTLADELKEHHEENNPLADQASTYSDLLNGAIGNVDWYEIAENLLAEKMNHGGYMKRGGKAPDGITKTEVKGDSEDGYHFNVYYNNNKTAGFVSTSYKTEQEAEDKLEDYKATGKYDYSGTAGMKGGGGVGREFKYLRFTPKENGLEISLTPEGLEKVKEDGLTYQNASDYFEDIQGNSEYIYHPNMGESGFGMTEAEGITDGYHPSEDVAGEYETKFPESAKVYWFPRYPIVFWGDELNEEGVVFFPDATVVRKQGGKADVTANYYRFRQHSPKGVTECAVPQWGQKVAEATKKGAKITTCKKNGKWMLQSILIPKQGVKPVDAKRMADEIKSKFTKKKKALGGVAETCTCDDIHKTIEGLQALRDTSTDESEKAGYQELINTLN